MNKTAVITGGVRRLGGEISRYLLNKGYHVISINSKVYSKHETTLFDHPNFESVVLNLVDISQQKIREFSESLKKDSNISVLINNASLFYETDFQELTEKQLDQFYTIHIKVPLFLSQSLSVALNQSQAEKCDIINIIDTSSDLLWTKYFGYNLTKNSLLQLTRLLAKEMGPKIRVNGISPGTIIPENGVSAEQIEFYKKQSILNKVGDADEIIRLIDFILHSNFTTGSIFTVDGGRSLL